jgi:peptidoglycan/xylan/chitin deacetylase (PgdA/CDA1 family)
MKHNNIYFADLAPLRSLFASGLPVLCYHKIGRRPAGVKFRSIYVGTRLFSRQASELSAEGYRSVSAARLTMDKKPEREVLLTFDDGSLSVLRNAMEPMAAVGFRAINYLVSDLLGGVNEWDTAHGEVPDRLMDEMQVREWMAAGHEIGAHTKTHPRLSRIPPAQAREEISGSKKSLEDRFGIPIRHFCYPYGDYSLQVRDMVEEAGYETAVTVDRGVWRGDADRFLIPRIGARAHSLNFRNVFKRLLGRPLVDVSPLLN